MYSVAICIPTYKRPTLLENLIHSIIKCNKDKSLIREIYIIIVDNDVNKTAEGIIQEFHERYSEFYNIYYYNFPIKGLSNVRNELIKKALVFNSDFLVFIDDDEYVESEWLNELIKTTITNNADATRGPVVSIVDPTISRYIACWFSRPIVPDNSLHTTLAAGNFIIKRTFLEESDIWFDIRFNSTGSEDSYFGMQILKKGARLYWSSKAIAYEVIQKNRANLKWLVKRHFRGASMHSYILKIEKQYFKILKKFIVNIVYVFIGICATIIIMLPIEKKYWGILRISEGVGGIVGFFNLLYKEYK